MMKKSLALLMVLMLVLGSFGFVYSEIENKEEVVEVENLVEEKVEERGKPEIPALESPLIWDGQGSDSEDCSKAGEDGRTEEGWIHWIVTTGLSIEESYLKIGQQQFEPSKIVGNAIHFMTPFYNLERLTGNVFFYFEGEVREQVQFVISDFCPGIEQEDPDPGTLIINKNLFDADDEPITATTRTFELKLDIGDITLDKTIEVGENIFPEIPVGSYRLYEQVPDDADFEWLEADEDGIEVVIEEGKNTTITLNNKLLPDGNGIDERPTITIIKEISGSTNNTDFNFTFHKTTIMPKAEFSLKNEESKDFISVDPNAEFAVEEVNIPEGYRLKEIKIDLDEEFYSIDGAEITFEVGEESVVVIFVNERIPIDDGGSSGGSSTKRDRDRDPEPELEVVEEIVEEEVVIIPIIESIPIPELEIEVESVPILPQTGETLPLFQSGLGMILAGLGIYLKRK